MGPGAGAQPGGGGGQATSAGQPGGGANPVGGAAGTAAAEGGSSSQAGGGSAGQNSAAGAPNPSGAPLVFVGGFGETPVRQYDLDKATGALSERPQTIDAGPEPTCLVADAARQHLYVCNEGDGNQGGITSYAVGADGAVTFINHQSGSDSGFTSLALHPSGNFIAGAAYSGGSTSVFPIAGDGSVSAEASLADFGDDAQSHCVAYDPTGTRLLVATKGTNAVQQLVQNEAGVLTPNVPPNVPTPTGPRHLTVHPNGKLAFVVAESGSALSSYQLSADGRLTQTASIPSVPADYDGNNTGAHVELSADGHFLYASNRGHDSIGVFSVNQETGALTLVEFEPSRGVAPHDFDIDPLGEVLVAGHRRSGSLTVFKIAADGSLSPLGEPVVSREDITAVLIYYPK